MHADRPELDLPKTEVLENLFFRDDKWSIHLYGRFLLRQLFDVLVVVIKPRAMIPWASLLGTGTVAKACTEWLFHGLRMGKGHPITGSTEPMFWNSPN